MSAVAFDDITLVRQINDETCVQACLAMATGMPIESVIKAVGTSYGLTHTEEVVFLSEHMTHWVPLALPHPIPGHFHFASVPSLNFPGGSHSVIVYYDAKCGLIPIDPNSGRAGRLVYGVDAIIRSYCELIWFLPEAKGGAE